MPRLKSRTDWPPAGFVVLHPESGQKTPFSGSFSEAVAFEIKFRRANPTIAARNGWTDDVQEVERYVDESNAQRCLANGWLNFVEIGDVPFAEKKTTRSNAQGHGLAAAAKTALSAYRDLFAHGPVAREQAEKRAAVCVACPLNNTKDTFASRFVEKAALELAALVGLVKDMNLTTSHDAHLGICDGCQCVNQVKVHVRLEVIERDMAPDVRAKLHPSCWVLAGQ